MLSKQRVCKVVLKKVACCEDGGAEYGRQVGGRLDGGDVPSLQPGVQGVQKDILTLVREKYIYIYIVLSVI
jgi:hypothetical protein